MTTTPLYRFTWIAIVGFILLFAYAFQQLLQIQNSVRAELGENMLWSISQAEREARKLNDAIWQTVYDNGPKQTVSDHRDILYSRLSLLNDTPQKKYFDRVGMAPTLERSTRALDELSDVIDRNLADATLEPVRTQALLGPMMDDLARLANRTMHAEREENGDRRDQQDRALSLVIMAVGGLMLTGAFLIWQLVVNARRATVSGAALAEHKTRLEAMVDERTAALSSALEKEKLTSEIYRGFITTVSHQFRTPLSIIDMAAQSFIRRPGAFAPDAIVEKAQRIRNACLRLMRMLESTTNAARLDGGAVPIDLTDNDLATIVENACIYQRELLPERVIEIATCERPLPCRCDAALIEQVVLNLLSNAAKYSPADTPITVDVRADGDSVFCRVTDKGLGIPDEDRAKIFTRFFRASNAANIPGTGLGLNLSRTIAGLHGGALNFAVTESGGTTFTLRLPRCKEK